MEAKRRRMIPPPSSSSTTTSTTTTTGEHKTSAKITMADMDLVKEIMSWLPSTSVVRFKSVCKQWHDIASTPSFLVTHWRRSPRKVSGLFVNDCMEHANSKPSYFTCSLDGGGSLVPHEPCSLFQDGQLLDSCNGLILGTKYTISSGRILWVYNPTIRQQRILPYTAALEDPYFDTGVLAFDPSQSPNYWVLFSTHCYREIVVYHGETHSWKTLFGGGGGDGDGAWSQIWYTLSHLKCFFKGLMYWLAIDGSLVSVDVNQGSISKIATRPPTPTSIKYHNLHFGQLMKRDRLYLFRCSLVVEEEQLDRPKVVEVLEMADDHSRWILLHEVHVEELHSKLCRLQWQPSVTTDQDLLDAIGVGLLTSFLVEGEEEDEEDKLVLPVMDKIVAYRLKSKTICLLCSHSRMGLLPSILPSTCTLVAP